MKAIKQFFKSKTINFGFVLAVLGLVQANLSVFTQYMTPEIAGWFGFLVGLAVIYLRLITTKSVGEK